MVVNQEVDEEVDMKIKSMFWHWVALICSCAHFLCTTCAPYYLLHIPGSTMQCILCSNISNTILVYSICTTFKYFSFQLLVYQNVAYCEYYTYSIQNIHMQPPKCLTYQYFFHFTCHITLYNIKIDVTVYWEHIAFIMSAVVCYLCFIKQCLGRGCSLGGRALFLLFIHTGGDYGGEGG